MQRSGSLVLILIGFLHVRDLKVKLMVILNGFLSPGWSVDHKIVSLSADY